MGRIALLLAHFIDTNCGFDSAYGEQRLVFYVKEAVS